MNVVQPTRGEKGATPIGLNANSHGMERRAIVDTHRHPIGPKLRNKMAESGSCPSGRDFAPRFLQTPPRDDALALR